MSRKKGQNEHKLIQRANIALNNALKCAISNTPSVAPCWSTNRSGKPSWSSPMRLCRRHSAPAVFKLSPILARVHRMLGPAILPEWYRQSRKPFPCTPAQTTVLKRPSVTDLQSVSVTVTTRTNVHARENRLALTTANSFPGGPFVR